MGATVYYKLLACPNKPGKSEKAVKAIEFCQAIDLIMFAGSSGVAPEIRARRDWRIQCIF